MPPRRHKLFAFTVSVCALPLLAACQANKPQSIFFEPGPPPSKADVQEAINRLPKDVERPVALKLHMDDKTYLATGTLVFRDPYDFRLTARLPDGSILFDARWNWAGINIFRLAPGLDRARITAVVRDFGMALRTPAALTQFRQGVNTASVQKSDVEDVIFRWTFASSGRLGTVDIYTSMGDQAEAQFTGVDARGWPTGLTLYRSWKGYSLFLDFTDVSASNPVTRARD